MSTFVEVVSLQITKQIVAPFSIFVSWLMAFDLLYLVSAVTTKSATAIDFILAYFLTNPSLVHKRGIVVIIGCDSSVGIDATYVLSKVGYHVIACSTKEQGLIKNANSAISNLKFNSIVQKDIQKLAGLIERELVRTNLDLVGLINCTASNYQPLLQPMEATDSADWEQVFLTNVIGPMNAIKMLIPLIRQSQGRIINVTCASAMAANPLQGPFSASMQALEASTNCLRLELQLFRVPVSLIQIGFLKSAISPNSVINPTLQPSLERIYAPAVKARSAIQLEAKSNSLPVHYCTSAIKHALTSPYPSPRYVVGLDAQFTSITNLFISQRAQDWIYQFFISSQVPKKVRFGN